MQRKDNDTLALLQLRILDHDLQHAKIASDVYEQLVSQHLFEALMFVYSSSSSTIINIQRACYTRTENSTAACAGSCDSA